MSLYVFGDINGERGLYRSDDNGAAWLKLNDERYGLSNVNHIEADRDVYGRVYVGTGGRGVYVCGKLDFEYSITSGGEVLDSIPEGDFSIELTVEKGINATPALAVAIYKDDRLVSVRLSEEKSVLNGEKFKVDVSPEAEFDTVRCFLWSFEDITPVIDYAEFRK